MAQPTAATTPALDADSAARQARTAMLLKALLLAWLAIRFWYAGFRNLAYDEAVYWSWSRHLAWGFLDHPPMVAALIHLSTKFLGDTELGVRFFAVLCAFGILSILINLVRRLPDGRPTAKWVAAIWLTSPMLMLLGTVQTPDAAVNFFSVAALGCAILACQADGRSAAAAWRWLAFGVFCGLALLSKYTAVLLPASVVLALAWCPEGRVHLRRPWIYLAAALALAIFWPVVMWNAQHDWVSFRFQFNHGLNVGASAAPHSALNNALTGAGEFLGGQLLAFTPILAIISGFVLVDYWRLRQISLIDRILLWSATLPLALFFLASLRGTTQVNWPVFAYFPLSLLLVRWINQRDAVIRARWLKAACALAVIFAVFAQTPQLMNWLPADTFKHAITAKSDETYGWPVTAAAIAQSAAGAPIVAGTKQDAGEIGFYAPGHPDVWIDPDGTMPTAFDYFDTHPDWAHVPRILYVGDDAAKFARRWGLTIASVENFTQTLPSGGIRSRQFTLLVRQLPPPRLGRLGSHSTRTRQFALLVRRPRPGESVNPQTIRKIDRGLGKPICCALTAFRRTANLVRPPRRPVAPPKKILLIKMIEQGATVLAYRAIARAVEMVGRDNVYFWVFDDNKSILQLLDLIPPENILILRNKGMIPFSLDVIRTLCRIRKLKIDATVDMEFFARASAILAFLTGASRRVGLHRFNSEGPYRGDLLTHRVQYNPYVHTAAAYLMLVESLLADPTERPLSKRPVPQVDFAPPNFVPAPGETQAVQAILDNLASRPVLRPLVLLNPNASDLLPLRRWPTDRFIELGKRLLDQYPQATLGITGAPDEAEAALRIARAIGPESRVLGLAGKTTLRQLMVLYTMGDVLVTNDSGPGHFSSMTDIHSIVLFGPETPLLFGPLGRNSHVLSVNLACSPCATVMNHRFSPCTNNVCMQEISVERVYAEVEKRLDIKQ